VNRAVGSKRLAKKVVALKREHNFYRLDHLLNRIVYGNTMELNKVEFNLDISTNLKEFFIVKVTIVRKA